VTFDFSALLVLLTAASGLIWAADSWFFRRRRQAAGREGESLVVEYARSFFPVFLVVLLLRSFVVEPFRIPSGSMMPTLLIGDFILVNKYDYGIRLPVVNWKIIDNGTPERGDIVVFRYPEDPSIPYIKRVVAVPGDHIEYRNKVLYVNGQAMEQERNGPYDGVGSGDMMDGAWQYSEQLDGVRHSILIDPDRAAMDVSAVVPEGHYFVMGDNRDNSRDSRSWGFVPDRNLIGHAFFIWMSWDRKNGGIGWNRIGTILR
jgi:signal peptidase I